MQDKYIKISIIMPVYNGEKTIRRAIESVICQTYDNIDLIIIDGGSSDRTLEIIHEYKDKIKYFVSRKDEGIYHAINDGISVCTADWYLVLGCDDALLDSVHLFVNEMSDLESIYYGNVVKRFNGKIYDGKFNAFKLMRKNIAHQCIFYPKSTFQFKYDVAYKFLADYKHNLKMWGLGYRFKYLPFIVSNYDDTGSSSTYGDYHFLENKSSILGDTLGGAYKFLWNIRNILALLYKKTIRKLLLK